MPIVDESKQNKGVNNNTRNKQMAIDMEYYNRLNHPRFKSPYLGAKYQQRVTPIRTLNGIRDVFVDNRGTIKQGGHTNSKLYNYSNKNRNHPIKGAYAREEIVGIIILALLKHQLIQGQVMLQLQLLRQYMIILKVLQIYLKIQLKLVIIQ